MGGSVFRDIGARVELIGEVHLSDGKCTLRDADGQRWSFSQDRRTRPFLGKRAIVEGECTGPGLVKVISIRAQV